MKRPILITERQARIFSHKAEEIFGNYLVSVKWYNRFIEVKFMKNHEQIYVFPVDWVSVARIDTDSVTIYLHDWCNGLERAERMYNPFYL